MAGCTALRGQVRRQGGFSRSPLLTPNENDHTVIRLVSLSNDRNMTADLFLIFFFSVENFYVCIFCFPADAAARHIRHQAQWRNAITFGMTSSPQDAVSWCSRLPTRYEEIAVISRSLLLAVAAQYFCSNHRLNYLNRTISPLATRAPPTRGNRGPEHYKECRNLLRSLTRGMRTLPPSRHEISLSDQEGDG
jgi:hypothetical protein